MQQVKIAPPRRHSRGHVRTISIGPGRTDSLTLDTAFALGMAALCFALVTVVALAKSAGWF